jgi:Subtilase family
MGSRRLSRWLVAVTVPAAMAMAAVPASAAAAAAHSGPAGGAEHQYVVILRNQNRQLGARSAARRAAVRAEQAPVQAEIRSLGARNVSSTSLVNAVIADMTAGEAQSLAANPGIAQVIPNGVIQGPVAPTAPAGTGTGQSGASAASSAQLCGTASSPQLNPEALSVINSVQANQMGYDGAGVTVALLADGLNPADPDFQRNPAFASPGSPAGSPVVTQADFSGDGVNAPTDGGEAFLDASSIAAQGNTTYDLSQYVNTAHPLPAGCDIKIQGAAPGASVLALKVFAQNDDTTTSGFLQAINYAVAQGAKVINESFGSNNFPDLTADAIRQADDAAVAAGVTVVVSSGDGGITSTIGSPATDPNVISVGATTTFRAYAQSAEGGINYPGWNGRYVDNNISSLSSGGVSQAGGTVDLVAPGDLNWALCDTDITLYSDCDNYLTGAPAPIQLTGGTSESSPLTAAAAADVIQAYASSHGGADPSPALVKQILMSTATDIGAPATQQGAGLLNVAAAVRLARSAGSGQASADGGLLVSPGQVTVTQNPGATTGRAISVTNTGSSAVSVALSTRALTDQVANQTGSFCMQPGTPTAACPANTGSFPIWSGVTEVYQAEHFTVPPTSGTSRLSFSADYPYTGQTSLLHFALFEPDGTYAAYSLPQGLGDYGNVQVTDPPAGRWTAVFFTEQDGATVGGIGTSGTVQWDASTSQYASAGSISPAVLSLGPGQTRSASLSLTSPQAAGDTSESVVISAGQSQTTIPVVVRTQIPVGPGGGTFSGVLTGGNGRADTQAQANTYVFSVPPGETDLDASVALANDPGDEVIGYLVDPDGQTVGYSSNVTTNSSFSPTSTRFMNLYHVAPEPGQWTLDLAWQNPVTGSELQEPFSGAIRFNQVRVSSNLPQHGHLTSGQAATYTVTVNNTGLAPEAFFADPRLNQSATVNLPDQNGSETNMSLPLAAGLTFPYYFVPTHTTQLQATLTGTVPVNFDMEYFPGDPDLSGVQSGDSASLTLTEPEVSPGMWLINPDEIGPYPATGAPAATATASLSAVTQAFDPAVTSSTGDFWSTINGLNSASFDPVYVPVGGKGTITVSITPTAAPGTEVSGTLYVSDFALGSFFFDGPALGDADDLAAIPYSYRVTG